MEDINSVTIIGRLCSDMELKYTNSGTAVGNLSLAVNRSRKQGDQWIEEASFFNIQLWGKRSESLAQYLLKGTKIAVSGSLKQDRWEKDGQKQSKVYIHADNIQLLGGKKDSQQNQQSGYGNNQKPNNNQQNNNYGNDYNPNNDSRHN